MKNKKVHLQTMGRDGTFKANDFEGMSPLEKDRKIAENNLEVIQKELRQFIIQIMN